MTLPSALLGATCALLIGTLFHLVVDGGAARLILYMILSTIGFGAGQWIASSQHWSFLPVGPLQLGPSVLGSMAALLLGHWLSKVNVRSTGDAGRV